VPRYTTLSSENRVTLHRPTPKVSENYYVAKRIGDHVEPADYVLAGHNFNLWMTTLNGHPYPLMTKGYYFEELIPKKEAIRRHRLVDYVDGRKRPRRAIQLLEKSIHEDSLAAVAVNERAPWLEEIENVLIRNEYSKVETFHSQRIWLKKAVDEPQ
jgi:hypothetical protein